ncbi:MAG TPA: ABC transporter substrate-binding protein [Trebonia sp.]
MRTIIARLLLAVGLCIGCAACGSAPQSAPVIILVPWDQATDPAEYNAFMAVIDQFEKTGIQVTVQTSRAESQQLDADLAVGDPPDIADFSSPAAVKQYLHGGLRPLKGFQSRLQDYAEPWRGLAMLGTGTVYSIPVKVDIQSLLWYPASAVKTPPATFTELQSLSRQSGTPVCLGLASGAASGWPGAKWIEDILASMYGAGAYKLWLAGKLPWYSPEVTSAWEKWAALIGNGSAVPGRSQGALETAFNHAMNKSPCILKHGALITTGLKSTRGYSFARFPSAVGGTSPLIVSGDFMGLFTTNPNATKLLAYLVSSQAQDIWVHQPDGDAFSANDKVPVTEYPLGVQQRIARLLLHPGAGTTICFAADDLMVPDMAAAFWQAVLDYVNNTSSLTSLLAGLQQTQEGAGPSPVGSHACSGGGAS